MEELVRLDRMPMELAQRVLAGTRVMAGDVVGEGHHPRLIHRFSPRVGVLAGVDATETFDDSGLDQAEELAVAAWRARSVARAPQPSRRWNAPGYAEPVHLDQQGPTSTVADANEAGPARYLVGSVAIGLVIVSRDQGPEQFTLAEQQKVVQQTLNGTNFLTQAEPKANVNFDYDIQLITVDVAPGIVGGSNDPYEQLEAPWRDAALAQLGQSAGPAGYRKYVEDLQQQRATRWAYVAFFTKYRVNHFAYAVDEKVVMHYGNDGWGPDLIDRVFAHETCHIFGAADEYGGCGCQSKHGVLQAPNSNCLNCPGEHHVTCLMDTNDLALCSHTRKQLGWAPPYIP